MWNKENDDSNNNETKFATFLCNGGSVCGVELNAEAAIRH